MTTWSEGNFLDNNISRSQELYKSTKKQFRSHGILFQVYRFWAEKICVVTFTNLLNQLQTIDSCCKMQLLKNTSKKRNEHRGINFITSALSYEFLGDEKIYIG